jgi:acetyltransferase-like isoleucine patch superfamily enzyme
MPEKLIMEEHAQIGHFTLCKGLQLMHIHAHGRVGNGNWITGFPLTTSGHFSHQADRNPALTVGEHAAITNRHIIDCTDSVTIGKFTTFAGFQSQILTHSINLETCRQHALPVFIGDYCFVGTNVVILGGSTLPSYSVLGAKSLLNKEHSDTYTLYAGVPAKPVKKLESDLGYFNREEGFVI